MRTTNNDIHEIKKLLPSDLIDEVSGDKNSDKNDNIDDDEEDDMVSVSNIYI